MARWLEGCACHPVDSRQELRKRHRRQRDNRLALQGPADGCPWRGRRCVELVQGRLDGLLDDVKNATSTRLQLLLHRASPPERTNIASSLHATQLAWVEEVDNKLRLHHRLPHMLAGAFDGVGCRSAVVAKEWAAKSLATFDDEPDHSKHHRLSLRLLRPGSELRAMLQRYADDSVVNLASMPELYVELRAIALCPLVERKIEQPHTVIHQTTTRAPSSLPPSQCAELRAAQILAETENPAYLAWLEKAWKVRCIFCLMFSLCFLSPIPEPP